MDKTLEVGEGGSWTGERGTKNICPPPDHHVSLVSDGYEMMASRMTGGKDGIGRRNPTDSKRDSWKTESGSGN